MRLSILVSDAQKFLAYDLESETFEILDNHQNLGAVQGAGIQSAETVVRLKASCLATGHCGPKVFRVLSAAGIKVFTTSATTVKDALEQYRSGKLIEMTSANAEAHWA